VKFGDYYGPEPRKLFDDPAAGPSYAPPAERLVLN